MISDQWSVISIEHCDLFLGEATGWMIYFKIDPYAPKEIV